MIICLDDWTARKFVLTLRSKRLMVVALSVLQLDEIQEDIHDRVSLQSVAKTFRDGVDYQSTQYHQRSSDGIQLHRTRTGIQCRNAAMFVRNSDMDDRLVDEEHVTTIMTTTIFGPLTVRCGSSLR